MNGRKNRKNQSSVAACFFLIVLAFTSSSCGLDTLYELQPPHSDGHILNYTNADRPLDYFSLITNESGENGNYDDSDFRFLGTEIYYKIYTSASTMESAVTSINNLNTTSDISAAATNIINSRKYMTLSLDSGHPTPLIEYTRRNKYVYIRLNKITGTDAYRDSIFTGRTTMKQAGEEGSTLLGLPRRSFNSKYGFNFNSKDSINNPLPANGDEDVNWSGEPSNGTWYVDMWAVSVGRDSTYTPSYSKVLHLGSVTIKESYYDVQ